MTVLPPFDLARTAAPVSWARGRWPNVDWKEGAFCWVGWERGRIAWRSVRQIDARTLGITGASDPALDAEWAAAVLGTRVRMPEFADPVLGGLAAAQAGLRPWSAGSLFEGAVSSIVGQSISVAAAAITERRLFERFNEPLEIEGRRFWPPPRSEELGSSTVALVRSSGVTSRRAEALVAVGGLFASGVVAGPATGEPGRRAFRDLLLAIPGIGPWTVESALLWGVGDADAHPTGDVALLRAAKRHYPQISSLRDLDQHSEQWKPYRGWAARLLWVDLLGFDDDGSKAGE